MRLAMPSTRSGALTVKAGKIAIFALSDHWQVAAALPEKFSSLVQGKALNYPPLSVGASKVRATELPSLLRMAWSTCGAAGSSSAASTLTTLLPS